MFQKAHFLFPFLICLSCGRTEHVRETVQDRRVHIEDSIHYSVPSLPMLCDELDYSSQYEDIGECKLHVEIKGEGIPIVLINGGPGGTHHTFHPWFSELEKKHRVIYYDQRGTGQSDFEAGDGYSFTQAVEDLDELRKELGIEKWIVCGFSYGGGLAQYYTSTYADKVLGMVLIFQAYTRKTLLWPLIPASLMASSLCIAFLGRFVFKVFKFEIISKTVERGVTH